ncbi:HpcH/HpaI aldolase/citrate lyase family protein [Alkaliphilus peptidifermentans]|uniref:Citrate lyase subunit beta / citryl-CoA lyase n=1 Tax=Alkaliphilus peptidifermentans DSM 18978 TaxID=1120976 RepID=A0A1G5JFM9_9FIRM|nr:CoA ester lyase [Alkaliphilus peptidifermentans]SCY86711.1 citrate lyase subunit beta / citryl-CoA lyase [Alkaliphilus peptidifermentans DSM 18978]
MINREKLLLRSMLFVPTYKESFIKHGIQSKADAIILDLEDSIPEQYKTNARNNIKKFLDEGAFKKIKTFVRINPIESKLVFEDFKYILHEDIDGFMLTKIYTADDMIYFDKLITQLEDENKIAKNHFAFVPLIETTSAVMDIYNIAKASNRTIALAFGGEDYLNDLEGLHGEPPLSFEYPRAVIALASRAAGLLPIDTPYLALNNFEGFMNEENISFEMGFAGCLLIHPKQINLANQCFTPKDEEIKRSQDIVNAIDKSKLEGSGVAMLGDKMIGPPMEKRARKVLRLMEIIREEKEKHDEI